jgi:hypothetical protein
VSEWKLGTDVRTRSAVSFTLDRSASAQRVDFAIGDRAGEIVWRKKIVKFLRGPENLHCDVFAGISRRNFAISAMTSCAVVTRDREARV